MHVVFLRVVLVTCSCCFESPGAALNSNRFGRHRSYRTAPCHVEFSLISAAAYARESTPCNAPATPCQHVLSLLIHHTIPPAHHARHPPTTPTGHETTAKTTQEQGTPVRIGQTWLIHRFFPAQLASFSGLTSPYQVSSVRWKVQVQAQAPFPVMLACCQCTA